VLAAIEMDIQSLAGTPIILCFFRAPFLLLEIKQRGLRAYLFERKAFTG
jgi:hypothetical protein